MSLGSVQWIGTATTLIRYGGFTLLTDPNFLHQGRRVYLGHGLWSRRLTQPALDIEELPELDAVVLSHLHGDHFDRVAKRRLDKTLPIVTTRAAARRLRDVGFGYAEALTPWQATTLHRGEARVTITSLPGHHARGFAERLLPPVMGALLEFSGPGVVPYRIYLTGDTLLHRDLDTIASRFPDIDLAVVHLGGTRVLGAKVSMDGRDGVDLINLIGPQDAVPVHYGDYGIFTSPLSEFTDELASRPPDSRVRVLARGESLPLPASAPDGLRS